jgi:hypothetical protein
MSLLLARWNRSEKQSAGRLFEFVSLGFDGVSRVQLFLLHILSYDPS